MSSRCGPTPIAGAGGGDGPSGSARRPRRSRRRGVGRGRATWTRTPSPTCFSGAGVPAAPMNRAVDVLADPQVQHRKLFTDMVHPLFDQPMPSETSPAPYRHIPPRRTAARADARRAHPRDLPEAPGPRHRGNRPPDRRGRACSPGDQPTHRGLDHDNAQDAGARRLRTGQPARREPERRTDRPDGGGGPRRRRPAGAGGRRLRTRRQPAVVALPRSRVGCSRSASRPTTPPPATPASAAMCRRRWSTRRAWTSRPDAPTSC